MSYTSVKAGHKIFPSQNVNHAETSIQRESPLKVPQGRYLDQPHNISDYITRAPIHPQYIENCNTTLNTNHCYMHPLPTKGQKWLINTLTPRHTCTYSQKYYYDVIRGWLVYHYKVHCYQGRCGKHRENLFMYTTTSQEVCQGVTGDPWDWGTDWRLHILPSIFLLQSFENTSCCL